MNKMLLLAVLGSGCAEPAVAEREQAAGGNGDDCGEHMCGSNSPVIDNLGFHAFYMDGRANEDGFQLLAFFDAQNEARTFRVYGGEIWADSKNNGTSKRGNDLVGARLYIVRNSPPLPLRLYQIKIAEVDRLHYWAAPAAAAPYALSYRLQWAIGTAGDQTFKDVCSRDDDRGGLLEFHAVLFEGDVINAASKVVEGLDLGLANVGCAGHALAKLHLSGHTQGAETGAALATSPDQRTTMLTALSGAYCGDGEPYTVAGVKLTWKDDNDWMAFSPSAAEVEAHWGPQGAVCLNTPRLEANPTRLGEATFPDGVMAAMGRGCDLPACPDIIDSHIVTANP